MMLKFYILITVLGMEKKQKSLLLIIVEEMISHVVERIREKETIPPGASKEAWWRERRYAFLDKYDVAP